MTEQEAWDIYFGGICSIRFHPRDDTAQSNDWAKINRAAKIADLMIEQRRKRQCRDGDTQWAQSQAP